MNARQLTLDLPHRPAMGGDDFLVAPGNREAVDWIDRWPDWPDRVLAIHGPEGCGKTHLVQVWRQISGAPVMEGRALDFAAGADVLAAGGALAVEDCGPQLAEDGLLHLLNWAREQGGSLLLTGRTAPARWPVALPDLGSRLRALTAVALAPPDETLIAALLVKLFADRQLRVGDEVIAYLLARIERSFAAVRDVVAAIDTLALAEGRRITVPLARQVLAEANGAGRSSRTRGNDLD